MTLTLGRGDNTATGLHEFFVEDNGEKYVFLAVKPGRVEKQKRLAAEKANEAESSQGEQG